MTRRFFFLEATHKDGKTLVDIEELENWDENPREVDETDIERLKSHIKNLGQYKPLVVTNDGTVVGGNMRLRALRQLGRDEVWVSVIEPEDEDELLEYALADNDRVGYYKEEQVADLLEKYEIDVARFKVDFYKPQDLAQNMATAMDPEELIDKTGGGGSSSDGEGEEGGSSSSRSMENLGKETATAMVQMFMSKAEKEEFKERVDELKQVYGVDTTSDVCQLAVKHEFGSKVEAGD